MAWLCIGFLALVGVVLAIDLGVFHRQAHVIQPREALLWSGVWVGLALLFNLFLYFSYEHHWFGMDLRGAEPDGRTAAVAYFTGYVLEKSLSVDNLFIIAVIFGYFAVPFAYQHRVLFWGILAALLMRGAMILIGVTLIQRFHWLLYGFGALLILASIRLFVARKETEAANNRLVRLVRRLFPVTADFEGQSFVVVRDGRRFVTPLVPALVAVECADLMLAVDSIPAIFAVTEDPFLIFTSNVFAVLGLRSLYFALAHVLDRLHYLNRSLAAILALIGAKMLLKDVLHAVPGLVYYTLAAVVVILAAGIVASLILPKPIAPAADRSDGQKLGSLPVAGRN